MPIEPNRSALPAPEAQPDRGNLDAAVAAWAAAHPDELATYFEDSAGSTSANPFLAAAEQAFWRVLG